MKAFHGYSKRITTVCDCGNKHDDIMNFDSFQFERKCPDCKARLKFVMTSLDCWTDSSPRPSKQIKAKQIELLQARQQAHRRPPPRIIEKKQISFLCLNCQAPDSFTLNALATQHVRPCSTCRQSLEFFMDSQGVWKQAMWRTHAPTPLPPLPPPPPPAIPTIHHYQFQQALKIRQAKEAEEQRRKDRQKAQMERLRALEEVNRKAQQRITTKRGYVFAPMSERSWEGMRSARIADNMFAPGMKFYHTCKASLARINKDYYGSPQMAGIC